MPKEAPQYKPDMAPLRRRKPLEYQLWKDERESAPNFTFLLRPRVIQLHQTCKLLCCLSGKPTPTVSLINFFKRYNLFFTYICIMLIVSIAGQMV